ncbi:MAG TPA: hypothetical protein VJL81_00495 [Solirubrobacterales bacterium]|nr:hypothetical protein [Solirubrobacterales bacterium]
MDRPTSRLTYANVVSTICLFLLLGGAAWAAKDQLAKNSVGTPQLKSGAVTGAKVKDGSLTGTDIKSSTLGQVPSAATAGTATSASHATGADTATRAASAAQADHATSADTATRAGDAATLDGLGPSAFYPAGGITRIDANPVYGAEPVTIYAADGLVLSAFCSEGGLAGSTLFEILATSSVGGARIDAGYVRRVNSTEEPIVGERGLGAAPTEVWSIGTNAGPGGQAVGNLLYTDAERGIQITLESRVLSSHACQVSGTAAVTG